MTEHVRGPDSPEPGLEDEYTRIADKRRFTGRPEMEGVPGEADIEGTDVEERLDENPDEATDRRDVPAGDTVASRTEDA
jgi:hypothetical protein